MPGSFELPVVAKAMAKSGNFDAVVCIGVVVRNASGTVGSQHATHACRRSSSARCRAARSTALLHLLMRAAASG